MNNHYMIEECFFITPRNVGGRFGHVRKLGINELENRSDISYWFDDMSEPTCLFVSVNGNEPQKFDWEPVDITFGETAYIRCHCGYRARKLYLPPNGKEFKCRKCHKLQYQLTKFNRHSIAGRSLYKMNRLQKLADSRANIGRILYNGNYTKKFTRFLGLCDRAGLESIVRGAKDLKTLMNG
ncbi:MAG: hypothetical protein UV53_C0006G0012 [Candidatus Azambacteria bacterium GW2011_GWE1_42_9]|nr:MAG: hypothetical protein UV45_C0001G0007 [Candidatus Azambacteria bacterium GW2011_GWB1_42_72]KKS79469.1 MAG: hypothetical protein UV53_C0006G0012 [Candidatus Azambacteria bacterium GW2011_GWE1_42_9]KKT03076.1 MAG: hypothetical protein UV81_C0004G0013 [Candidatus Azambacteria bacterium GW2011_GWD1_43_18]KKT17089.1 MAG: hypothetical protein UV99_C0001G0025 [Parcubacteria group bacterium GW2011_GWC1_43_61]OGD40960.1 MAG: hypothetical protein A3K28_00120 [Candidatus Azambacteria bacterium RIFO